VRKFKQTVCDSCFSKKKNICQKSFLAKYFHSPFLLIDPIELWVVLWFFCQRQPELCKTKWSVSVSNRLWPIDFARHNISRPVSPSWSHISELEILIFEVFRNKDYKRYFSLDTAHVKFIASSGLSARSTQLPVLFMFAPNFIQTGGKAITCGPVNRGIRPISDEAQKQQQNILRYNHKIFQPKIATNNFDKNQATIFLGLRNVLTGEKNIFARSSIRLQWVPRMRWKQWNPWLRRIRRRL